eukprot:SAG31_NODE_260_length_18915_cov_3.432823_12_plen_239_part_00
MMKNSGASHAGNGYCKLGNRYTMKHSTRSPAWVGNSARLNHVRLDFSRSRPLSETLFCDTHVLITRGRIHADNGGAASILEPIADHLPEYEFVLASYFGSGTQAAYRGTRLFDEKVPASRNLVAKWVTWFKQYRTILNSDIIHVKRPDLAGLDAMLHVNANKTRCDERGLLVIWNQTPEPQATALSVPLYYTGLTDTAIVSIEGKAPTKHMLDRDYRIVLNISMAPMSVQWVVITENQ